MKLSLGHKHVLFHLYLAEIPGISEQMNVIKLGENLVRRSAYVFMLKLKFSFSFDEYLNNVNSL